MNQSELIEKIKHPESDVLEFKARCPQTEPLAALISAFANTRGGVVLIGIDDNGAVVGIDNASDALRTIEKVSDAIIPPITYSAEIISADKKNVVAINIDKGRSPPHSFNNNSYQRVGSRIINIGSPQAPDVQGAAYQAVLGGSGAIAQGVGAVAVGVRGIAVGGDIQIKGGADKNVIPYDSAFERVAASTTFVLDQLEQSYKQIREQSQGWYRFSAIAAGSGFLLIVIGVIAVLLGQTTAGVITSAAGIIPEAAAALFFSQGKQANSRVDVIQEKLGEARELLTALEIANTITDENARNEMKKSIVLKALGLSN